MAEVTLQALREQGAARHDPARFHYLEALERRMATQAAPVQAVLQQRLHTATARYLAACQAAPLQGVKVPQPASNSDLLLLSQEINGRRQTPDTALAALEPGAALELHSVRRFRETWAKVSAQQQLRVALERGPKNAGPLNSHRLVLRALLQMQRLSPAYLRYFLAQAGALMWLDDGAAQLPRANTKPVRAARRKG